MTPGPASDPRRYGQVFDELAADYDRHRPAYPDELVDQACQVAGIGPGDRVLEVGCGTGQLTRSLLARGLHVTALEPGANLIALATRNLAGKGASAVEFVPTKLEDALLPHGQFPAVFSASAFHWVDPEVSWRMAADALVPGGTLALIQYFGLEEPRSQSRIRKPYSRPSPENRPGYRRRLARLPRSRRHDRRGSAAPRGMSRRPGVARRLRPWTRLRGPAVRRCPGGRPAHAGRAHSGRAQCPGSHDVVLLPARRRTSVRPSSVNTRPSTNGSASPFAPASPRRSSRPGSSPRPEQDNDKDGTERVACHAPVRNREALVSAPYLAWETSPAQTHQRENQP